MEYPSIFARPDQRVTAQMEIVDTCAALSAALATWRSHHESYAFVPTMGALHEGHLTLVREALQHYPKVVASVFVNPTQFDRPEDLAKYPRQPELDAQMLSSAGAQLLFLPSVEEIYPPNLRTYALPDLAGLDTRYEGAKRPGHFAGVVQVVRRLVELVRPEAMYMGQKDAQQLAVLRQAAAQEFWPVRIIGVPTVREANGLAMSSRNGRLSTAGFAEARLIHDTLQWAKAAFEADELPSEISAQAQQRLRLAGFEPEYFDFVHAATFMPLANQAASTQKGLEVLLITVAWLEGVRLIDNLHLGAIR